MLLRSFCLGLIGLTTSLASVAAEGDIFTRDYLMRDLDNGLRVIIVPTEYPDVVSLQIPVQTGSRNEIEPGKSGFAHFFEHMMFRGTEKYPADAYKQALKEAGADQNAYTTDDYTNYHINFTKPDLEKVLELEADRFMNLSYAEPEFKDESKAVKGEYLKNSSNPVSKIFERIRALSFTEHTYRHTTMGFLEDIEDMPNQFEYAKVFFDRWYRPSNAAVILVGDLEAEPTFALVEKYFGEWEPGDYQADIPLEPAQTEPKYEHIAWESPTQPWIMYAFRGPAIGPDAQDMAALDTAGDLFFGQTSDVYKQVVNTEQWADQFFFYLPARKDPQLMYVGARLTDAENAAAVVEAIDNTLVAMRTELVDPTRLAETKSRSRYGFAGGMDNSADIAGTLAQYVHFDRDPAIINDLFRSYSSLTAEDLRAAANQYIKVDSRTVVTLSNDESMPAAVEAMGDIDAMVAASANRSQADVDVVELHSDSDLIDLVYLFEVGPALDPEGKKGLSQLTAMMIADGGSAAMTIDEINRAMFPMAAGLGYQVDKEMTRFAGQIHRDNVDDWYRIVRGMLLEPGWREDDFSRLQTQLVNSIETNLKGSNDEELGKEVLYEQIYPASHPYGSLNNGHVADVQALTLADVQKFYRDHYTQSNLTVGLAGGFSDEFKSDVLVDLSALPVGIKSIGDIPQVTIADGRHATIVEKDASAVAVSWGFPIDVRRGDDDFVALWLARSWLGEHRSSNSYLYQRIRADRGMNYGDYAYIEYYPRGMFLQQPDANVGRQQQIFQVWLRPLRTNNDALFATRVSLFEVEKMIRDGMSESDFTTTRDFLAKYVAQAASSQSRQLQYAMDSDYYDIGPFSDYIRDGLDSLTLEQVNTAIREHLNLDDIHFAFVSQDAAGLKAMIESGEATPLAYDSPKSDELLAEDKVIEQLELGIDSIDVVPLDEVF